MAVDKCTKFDFLLLGTSVRGTIVIDYSVSRNISVETTVNGYPVNWNVSVETTVIGYSVSREVSGGTTVEDIPLVGMSVGELHKWSSL